MLNTISKFITSNPIGKIFNLGKKTVAWKKVTELKPGARIAIASSTRHCEKCIHDEAIYMDRHASTLAMTEKIEWDEIVSIKSIGQEQVYDIEVEGTHNFVGNGIVAHNTYINSTATTADIKGLEIAQSGAISGTGYGLYAAKTGASTTNIGGYFSASGATNNYGLIVEAGQVGVGTTSPTTKLHVEGACVTGDTLIRRKRKKKKRGKGDEDEWLASRSLDEGWEDVPITDINIDDEILTLDEKTGNFVVSKVEKIMDKGYQEVWKMQTRGGAAIETTGNHPYFVQPRKSAGTFDVDQSNRIEKLEKDSFLAIADSKNSTRLKITSVVKRNLKSYYRKSHNTRIFGPEVFALLIVYLLDQMAVLPAVLVIDEEYTGYSDLITRIIRNSYPGIGLRFDNIGKKSPAHLAAYELGRRKHKKATVEPVIEVGTAAELHREFTRISLPAHDHFLNASYPKLSLLSRQKWVKTAELKPGILIATVNGWEPIKKLYRTGRKYTYDLQIANTHNFVGNGIVAHNTTGKALAIFNETGNQNIFTASASGTPVFTIGRTGILSLNQNSQLNTAGTLLIDSTGTLSLNTTNNQAITTGTGLTTLGGNLVLNNSASTTTFGGLAYTWPSSQSTNYVLATNGSGVL